MVCGNQFAWPKLSPVKRDAISPFNSLSLNISMNTVNIQVVYSKISFDITGTLILQIKVADQSKTCENKHKNDCYLNNI